MKMDKRAQEIADEVRGVITRAMSESERSAKSADKRIGVSDLGHCREYARLMIDNVDFTDEQDNYLAAFVGTAVGDWIERHLDYETQAEVEVTIPVRGQYTLTLVGHPDVVIRDKETGKVVAVWDFKTKNGLTFVKREDVDQSHKFQLTSYGKAYIDAGEADPDNLELADVYIDRGGSEPDPHVKRWQWSQQDWDEIVEWLDDVVDGVITGEGASKDKPRDWCRDWCPYATQCWGDDTDVVGLIEDPNTVSAVNAYIEGKRMESEGKRLKQSAMIEFKGVSGNVMTSEGMKSLRWVQVNGTSISYEREPYMRLSLSKVK